ncbi:hypothetical protein OG802_33930 [Streptomyces sp. NBC_00704]|uniref:hypothetical protein n=1 Tax=Streptomyces sp. NBC_00704 TaxID=2975809 RepID=UPI002E2F5C23|nr:hypothetical protein [Streptomyces sp. NBC_00704]
MAAQPPPVNWAMHFSQAALLGVPRSLMSQAGLRGPLASAKFTAIRLTNDQILESATGVGAQPGHLVARRTHRGPLYGAVYAFTTGAATTAAPGTADALAARNRLGPGQAHAALRTGRRSGIGPLPRSDASAR